MEVLEVVVSGGVLALVVLIIGVYVRMGRMERRLTDRIGSVEVAVGRLEVGQQMGQRNLSDRMDRMEARLSGRAEPDRAEAAHA